MFIVCIQQHVTIREQHAHTKIATRSSCWMSQWVQMSVLVRSRIKWHSMRTYVMHPYNSHESLLVFEDKCNILFDIFIFTPQPFGPIGYCDHHCLSVSLSFCILSILTFHQRIISSMYRCRKVVSCLGMTYKHVGGKWPWTIKNNHVRYFGPVPLRGLFVVNRFLNSHLPLMFPIPRTSWAIVYISHTQLTNVYLSCN